MEKGRTENEPYEEEITKPYVAGTYSYDAYDIGDFTLNLRNKAAKEVNQGVYYEIFVRPFADSGGDGIWLMPINKSSSYHGYDITDYTALNSDYGTEEDFIKLLQEAHTRGIKVIMDFSINHTSDEHPWFVAALEDEKSEYRNYYRWVYKNDTEDFDKTDKSDWGNNVWHKTGDSQFVEYSLQS